MKKPLKNNTKQKKLSLSLYRKLYLVRRVEERIKESYEKDEMKTPMHMSQGGEAIAVGVLEAVGEKSQAFGTYRSHALYLARTMETDKFFAEMYGKVTGTAKGKGGSMHLASPETGLMMTSAVVGTTIPVAVGAALANTYLQNKEIVVCFFGDGAINEGVFWESVNFACLKKLPILFVCEDNDFAIHSRVKERTGHKPIDEVMSTFHCHVGKAATTDVQEIYGMTKNVVAKMKKSGMPGFLHLKYYRYLEHVGVNEDFISEYRSKKEMMPWLKVDPINIQRKTLVKLDIAEKEIAALEKHINAQIEKSIAKAQKDPFPKAKDIFEDIYV